MKRVLVMGASNSKKSINKTFAHWVASQLQNIEVVSLDLNDFEMPIYGVDRQAEIGIPQKATQFIEAIASADAVIISMAEHNGSYTTAFKNVVDWATRIDKSIWQNRTMFLLGTAPGPRGAKGVLQSASASFPRWGAQVAGLFSLPQFSQNFNLNNGIVDAELRTEFDKQLQLFAAALA